VSLLKLSKKENACSMRNPHCWDEEEEVRKIWFLGNSHRWDEEEVGFLEKYDF